MRIPSGVTDQYIYFVAVDATDLKTFETGISSWTVYRSRNGGSATAYTTPTITEVSSSNMPGVYKFLLDEDMTLDSGDDAQEICLRITASGVAPITRVIELYRPETTAGETLSVSSGALAAIADGLITAAKIASDAITAAKIASDAITAAKIATGAITSAKFAAGAIDAAAIATDAIDADALKADAITEIQSGLATSSALSTVAGYLDTEVAAILSAVDTEIASILADTNELQTDLTDGGRLDLLIDAIKAKTDNLPSDPADASVIAGLIAASEAKIDTIDGKVDTVDTVVDAVKAKTDSLTFTVAGQVDANIQYVNDVQVTGDGETGTEWGPT